MSSFRNHPRLTLGPALVSLAVMVAGCAPTRPAGRHFDRGDCEFVVHNRTPHALEVRLIRERSTTPVGALNPGESLTHAVSCAEGRVWIAGVAIPAQVGAPASAARVNGGAYLVHGEKATVALQWP